MSISKEEFDKIQAFTLANNAMIANLLLVLRMNKVLSVQDINDFMEASKLTFAHRDHPIFKEVLQHIEEMREVALTE